MIQVDANKVSLSGNTDDIVVEFTCLCVCLLERHSRIYPGHEEDMLKELIDFAIQSFKKGYIKGKEDGREEKRSH